MPDVFKKLNLGAHDTIHVLNAPASFEAQLAALKDVTVKRSVAGPSSFAMAFVITTGDAVLWMVYPKGTSRRYRCEFNRDSGWPLLGAAGFEPVRRVAIDEDWSALRFRRVEHIKSMTRKPAATISRAGKRKTSLRRAPQ